MSSPTDRFLFTPPTPVVLKKPNGGLMLKPQYEQIMVQPFRAQDIYPCKRIHRSRLNFTNIRTSPDTYQSCANRNQSIATASPIMLPSCSMYSTPKFNCPDLVSKSIPKMPKTLSYHSIDQSVKCIGERNRVPKGITSPHEVSNDGDKSCNAAFNSISSISRNTEKSSEKILKSYDGKFQSTQCVSRASLCLEPQTLYKNVLTRDNFIGCKNSESHEKGVKSTDRNSGIGHLKRSSLMYAPENRGSSYSLGFQGKYGLPIGSCGTTSTPCRSLLSMPSPLSSSTRCSSLSSVSLKSDSAPSRAQKIQTALNRSLVFCDKMKFQSIRSVSPASDILDSELCPGQLGLAADLKKPTHVCIGTCCRGSLENSKSDSGIMNKTSPISERLQSNRIPNKRECSMCLIRNAQRSLLQSGGKLLSPHSNLTRENLLMDYETKNLRRLEETGFGHLSITSPVLKNEKISDPISAEESKDLSLAESTIKRRRTSEGRVIYTLSIQRCQSRRLHKPLVIRQGSKVEICKAAKNSTAFFQPVASDLSITTSHICRKNGSTLSFPGKNFLNVFPCTSQGVCTNGEMAVRRDEMKQLSKKPNGICSSVQRSEPSYDPCVVKWHTKSHTQGTKCDNSPFFLNPSASTSFSDNFESIAHEDRAFSTLDKTRLQDTPYISDGTTFCPTYNRFALNTSNLPESNVRIVRGCATQLEEKGHNSLPLGGSNGEKAKSSGYNVFSKSGDEYKILGNASKSVKALKRCTPQNISSQGVVSDHSQNTELPTALPNIHSLPYSQSTLPCSAVLRSSWLYDSDTTSRLNTISMNKKRSMDPDISQCDYDKRNACHQDPMDCKTQNNLLKNPECLTSTAADFAGETYSSNYRSCCGPEASCNGSINTEVILKLLQQLAETNANKDPKTNSSYANIPYSFWGVCRRVLRLRCLETSERRKHLTRVATWSILVFLVTGSVAVIVVWSVIYRRRLEVSSSVVPYDDLLDFSSFSDSFAKDVMLGSSKIL